MHVEDMTYEQLMGLPRKKWDEEIECNEIVIIPYRLKSIDIAKYNISKLLYKIAPKVFREPQIYDIYGMHDSGYRIFSLVLCKDNEPICISDGGDVLHMDGIGGYGHKWLEKYGHVPNLVPPAGWMMDCLPVSGLFRLWCNENIIVGHSLSSQEIFMKKREKKANDG